MRGNRQLRPQRHRYASLHHAGWLLLAAAAAATTLVAGTPENRSSHAVLVADDEPGTPLTVSGTIFQPDGTTPAPGVRLYVYNTDAGGVYSKDGDDREHSLEGWLVSGDDGGYSFRTVKPGSYPGSRIPAHVHFVIDADDGTSQRATLQFADDPFISETRKERARAAGAFASIRPLEAGAAGGLTCRFDIRLNRRTASPEKEPAGVEIEVASPARTGSL